MQLSEKEWLFNKKQTTIKLADSRLIHKYTLMTVSCRRMHSLFLTSMLHSRVKQSIVNSNWWRTYCIIIVFFSIIYYYANTWEKEVVRLAYGYIERQGAIVFRDELQSVGPSKGVPWDHLGW